MLHKNIQEVYLDRGHAIRIVKSGFVDFNLNGKIRSLRLSGIDNNPWINTDEIALKINVDNSTAFRHLKQLGYTSKLDASEIGNVAASG